ncbi:zinc finger, CCHC-type containing protein [Tanacetum coccineum]
MQSRAMKLNSDKLRHDQKCKNMKRSQDMQLIQKLRDDQKRMKKVFEVMSGRNIVTNSRVTPSWREIVSLTFSEAGVLHVNWTSFGHCVPRRGIYHETTAPYTPQQNGVAERKNRALKEIVNDMLSYSGLSDGFWGEAMLTACYLLNMVPNKRNKTTPYELCQYQESSVTIQHCSFSICTLDLYGIVLAYFERRRIKALTQVLAG